MSQDVEFVSHLIIGRAIRVHGRLGPGLMESVYHMAFYHDLRSQGLFVESKKSVSFEMDGHRFENAFVADLVVAELARDADHEVRAAAARAVTMHFATDPERFMAIARQLVDDPHPAVRSAAREPTLA